MITVHYWPGIIPHLSLSIVNNEEPVYISFYPPNDASSVDFCLHTYQDDLEHRPEPPSKSFVIPSIEVNGYGLSEKAIITWLNTSFANIKPSYKVFSNNCSSVVLEALKNGAITKETADIFSKYSSTILDTPDQVFDFTITLTEETTHSFKFEEQLTKFRLSIPKKISVIEELLSYDEFLETNLNEINRVKKKLIANIHDCRYFKQLDPLHPIRNAKKTNMFINELILLLKTETFQNSFLEEKEEIFNAMALYTTQRKHLEKKSELSYLARILLKTHAYLNKTIEIAHRINIDIDQTEIRKYQMAFITEIKLTDFWTHFLNHNPYEQTSFWNQLMSKLSTYLAVLPISSKDEKHTIFNAIAKHLFKILPIVDSIISQSLTELTAKRQNQEHLANQPSWLNTVLRKVGRPDACRHYFTYATDKKSKPSHALPIMEDTAATCPSITHPFIFPYKIL